MTRLATIGCCALLWLGGATARAEAPLDCPPSAQPPSAAQARAAAQTARDRGFLWRISRGGHASYLYGTVHVARVEWMFPGPAVRHALARSDTVALELDLGDPDILRRMSEGISADPAPLPDALRRRLRARAARECVPEAALAAYIPEMQIDTLTVLAGRRDGLDPAYGIDMALAGLARARHKAVVSLETPELQIGAIRAHSPAEAAEAIGEALDELDSGRARALLLRLATAWAESDLATLSSYGQWCDCLNTPREREEMVQLIDARNPGLADTIAALHAAGRHVFAAVGSLHMIGATGLPALLAARGFRVERIAAVR